MFTNFGKDRHSAWRDEENNERETHARLDVIVSGLMAIGRDQELVFSSELNEEGILKRLEHVHSRNMIQAIKQASLSCKLDDKKVTDYDLEPTASYAPIDSHTYNSALYSVDSAIKAAELLKNGERLAFSISRPPGHHAGRDFYHGFCYFNNAAVAADTLRQGGAKVAILDIDVHHGDGTQDIFYEDPDIFYASLHADPKIILPHTGFSNERGIGAGIGTTLNIPMPIGINVDGYKVLLHNAVDAIKDFKPKYLVLSAGFDTHKKEKKHLPPLTQLDSSDYFYLGEIISQIDIPICVVLEGGYNIEVLSEAFIGLLKGLETTL